MAEKEKLASSTKIKEQLDQARAELDRAQRTGDLAKAGELAYGRIPSSSAQLKAAEEKNRDAGDMVEEAVTPDHIAQVVSRWTGIPVDKMLEGERDKLLRMEDELAKRVVGQAEAVHAVVDRRPPRPRRAAGSATGRSARSCSSARPASARPS